MQDSQASGRTLGLSWSEWVDTNTVRTQRRTITEADLVGFTSMTWMTEELFTVTDGRSKLAIQERVVPGALVYSFSEGLVMPFLHDTGLAFLRAEMDIKEPTFVGDTISVEIQLIEKRLTSTPGRGLVKTKNRVFKQTDSVVLEYDALRMIRVLDIE